MKKLLFFFLTLFTSLNAFSQCLLNDQMTLLSQQAVDDFGTEYAYCPELHTELKIEGSSITNIDALLNFTSIFKIQIINCPALTNINGLANLTSIYGSCTIENNDALVDLSGLENLSVITYLSIKDNDALQSFVGLENLIQVKGTLLIENNDALQDLTELSNLQTISQISTASGYSHGSLVLRDNDSLINLNGLENLMSIRNLIVSDHIALQNLTTIPNLGTLSSFVIRDNPNLQNLDGLQSLTDVFGTFNISNNYTLESLDGIENLDEIEGYFLLVGNVLLTDISALDACSFSYYYEDVNDSYGGYYIIDNSSLSCCDPVCTGLLGKNAQIENNAPGCNSYQEFSDYCDDDIDCLLVDYAKITAQAFIDENQNGVLDNQESLLDGIEFEISPNETYAQNGHIFYVVPNTYQISTIANSNWSLTTPSSLQTTITGTEEVILYWGLTPNGANYTIEPSITSSFTRCNQEVNFWLDYVNLGNIESDGQISMTIDPSATFIAASPSPDNIVNNTLYWSFENLFPNQNNQIQLLLEMPGVDILNQDLLFSANIDVQDASGAIVSQAETTYSSTLLCSYDPNDKLVQPDREGEENHTAFDEELTYTVRFQNTGNDTAFTVVIVDQLDANLDWGTFRPISASHDFVTETYSNGVVKFIFDDILLVDSLTNEPGSHGFVKYKISPLSGLSELTQIQNTANILFDANPAIITNTTINTLVDNISCPSFSDINVDVISGNVVKFTWSSSTNTESVTIRYRELGASNWITLVISADNFTTLNGLDIGTTYEFQIQWNCNAFGNSPWSSLSTFRTKYDSCDRPLNLIGTLGGVSTINVSWDENSSVDKYKLRYALSGTENWIIIDPIFSNTYTLNNLIENENYDIAVKAKCSNGWTNWTESITVQTGELPSCQELTDLSVSIISGNVIRFDWTASDGAIAYNLRYRVQGNSSWIYVALSSDVYTSLNELTPNTIYEYQFQTDCNTEGLSTWTMLDTFTTSSEICDRPNNFQLTQSSTSSVLLEWDDVPSATKYKIYYALANDDVETVITLNDVNSYTVNGLLVNTNYRFSIKAKCTAGWTNWKEDQFLTITDAPASCDIPIVSQEVISGNVVKLIWPAINGAEKYKIRYKTGTTTWTEIQSYYPSRFINDLISNTVYEAQVKTICEANASVWSPSIIFTTDASNCDRPANININVQNPTLATVTWDLAANAEKYKIKWKGTGTNEVVTIQNSTTNSFNLNNLSGGIEYKVLLKTKCKFGWTNYSQPVYFTTPNQFNISEPNSIINNNTQQELTDSQIHIAPNPFKNQFQIKWANQENASIELYNTLGQLVHSFKQVESGTMIPINNLEQGTYILKIKIDSTYFTKLIIKYD